MKINFTWNHADGEVKINDHLYDYDIDVDEDVLYLMTEQQLYDGQAYCLYGLESAFYDNEDSEYIVDYSPDGSWGGHSTATYYQSFHLEHIGKDTLEALIVHYLDADGKLEAEIKEL